ncbi:MAG: 30S ribosomal protein S8 [Puniceicoccales bacterium]|jgi:small subunit ribosomal protein S8|nr:30S ribosomal protein S8 [Puniceicoccales bacterium]
MDTIGDFLTVMRNAVAAGLPSFEVAVSRVRGEILRILQNAGYIDKCEKCLCESGRPIFRVTLRYVDGKSPICAIRRFSKPGRRFYFGARHLPRPLGGLGIAIVSTSKGLMRDSEARRKNIGGEVLCEIW